jgi:molybdopterin/thiamine biosynthesis adenylyltransferase
MEDQHSLELYYKEAIRKVEEFLKKEYNAIPQDDDSFGGAAFMITLNLEVKRVNLIIHLPKSFPDEFPTVTLSEESFADVYPIPHLDLKKVVCTFDENEAFPNADMPVEVVQGVIERAKDNLEKGIRKLNLHDYNDEFAAYWKINSINNYLSIIEPTSEPKNICLYRFITGGKKQAIFADYKMQGERWVKNVYGEFSEKEVIDALYLPLKDFGHPPFPKTNREMFLRIIQHSPESKENLRAFLEKSKRPSYIVFSLKLKNEYFLGVWVHQEPYKSLPGPRRCKTDVDGFRPGKAPANLELLRDFPDMPLYIHSIERADRKRIWDRGGNGNLPPFEGKKISVIGCGSIGSNLVDKLVKMGCNNLFLVDNDDLKFENIARHYCGASYHYDNKTVAIERKLCSHHPELIIKTYEKEIIEQLLANQNFLNVFDINFVCLGNTGIELRLNKLIKDLIITKPMFFIWVEPYLAAGHAVYVQPKKPGCFRCLFDGNLVFRENVLKDPGRYTKREAGCRTSFVPYGALDIDAFLVELSRFIIKVVRGQTNKTFFTWLGDLKEMRRLNRPLQSKWIGADSYTVHERLIPGNYYCKDCLK